MSPSRFCEQCGSALGAGARFCGNCGQPVQAAPAPPAASPPSSTPRAAPPAPPPVQAAAPSAPAPDAEPVIGIIPGLERGKGFMKTETFFLLVTPARLVFALVPQALMNAAIQQARADAKQQGQGLFGQVAAQMAWMDVVAERYAEMPVEEALAEEPDSFFIPNNAVRQAEITPIDFRRETLGYNLVIDAGSAKYRFTLKGASREDAWALLQPVLGNRMQ